MTATPADEPSRFDAKAFLRGLTRRPGVYRMYAADDAVLYVGKAASLRKRVANYFTRALPYRTQRMVAQIARIEVTATRNEAEALLLENQLIKSLRPKYNVLLRDDKSFPYIHLGAGEWPRLGFHRGPRREAGRYFGPYPSTAAVRETLSLMHKLFGIRSCEDSVFHNRSRPCLQYQIGRCSAPCVELVTATDYAESVRRVGLFLEGRSHELADELNAQMERASGELRYEDAARLRDLVGNLRRVQARQYVEGTQADMDVLACRIDGEQACVTLLCFRNGLNLGTRAFHPRLAGADRCEEVLAAFVGQYYLEQRAPREIVLSHRPDDDVLLASVLGERSGHRVELRSRVRGERARYLELAMRNAELSLDSMLRSGATQRARLQALVDLLGLGEPPRRIECFDISHTMGEATVAACVVFDREGPVRSQYRRYNITDIEPGDDYAAMRQVLRRRFRRGSLEAVLPDLLLIDGGRGQLSQAVAVLAEIGIDGIRMLGIAKGVARTPGHESLVEVDGRVHRPGGASPALQLVQQVRDEAHRFAITGHRGKRQKTRGTSRLEDIAGVGPRRRAALLKHFGGLAGLREAGTEEIAQVAGINAALAERIYSALHGVPERPGD